MKPHPVSCLLGLSILLCALAGTASIAGLRVCTTESLPLGLYRIRPGHPVERGNLVLVCLPPAAASVALERGYIHRGRCEDGTGHLGKGVLAVEGDELIFSPEGVRIEGTLLAASAPLAADTLGRPLRHWPFGRITLAPGTVWLHSSFHPGSFDSRYFGPVPMTSIVATLRPVAVAQNFRMRKSAAPGQPAPVRPSPDFRMRKSAATGQLAPVPPGPDFRMRKSAAPGQLAPVPPGSDFRMRKSAAPGQPAPVPPGPDFRMRKSEPPQEGRSR